MKAVARLGLAALAAALLAGVASAASPAPPRITEAGGSVYPQVSYILTLPSPRALTRSDLRVTENGAPVAGLSLNRQGTASSQAAVVLAIDESLSMKGKPDAAAFAAARDLAAHANPNQQIAIVTFNGKVGVLQGFTSDPKTLDNALSKPAQVAYGTKIYDALAQAQSMLSSQNVPSRSIIILTDGTDVGSSAKPGATLSALSQAHIRVFTVGLASPSYSPGALQNIAATTGGRYAQANSPAALRPIVASVGRQFGREYLITYTSHANPNTHVKVAVSVKGIPSAAETAYTTPALKIVPAPPYSPSLSDQVVTSWWLAGLVAIAFAVLIGFAIAHATASRSEPLVERVGGFVSVQTTTKKAESPARRSRRSTTFLTRVSTSANKSGWAERLGATLELADVEIDPYQLVLLTIAGTILGMIILGALFGVIGYVIGIFIPLVVRFWVLRRVAKKRRAFAEQLPDNLDVLASALRAGHSLVSALTVVADDAPEPSKSEFQRVLAEEQFGANLEDALKVAIDRMENKDLDQVALVARLQREVGSNSAEVLDRVIDTVRARMELRRLVRTLTAQGRLSRWILTILPIALALVITLIAPNYMHPLFHETLGKFLLVCVVLMVALGSWIIGKIVDIKVF